MFRRIEKYSDITKAYEAIIRHIRNSELHLQIKLCHIQNPGILTTRGIFKSLSNMYDEHAYSEP